MKLLKSMACLRFDDQYAKQYCADWKQESDEKSSYDVAILFTAFHIIRIVGKGETKDTRYPKTCIMYSVKRMNFSVNKQVVQILKSIIQKHKSKEIHNDQTYDQRNVKFR